MSGELTEEDHLSLNEALSYGWDKTGKDLGAVLRAASYRVSDDEANKIAATCKIGPEETLTPELLCSAAIKVAPEAEARKYFLEAFKCMDKHNDGTITVTDLRLVLGNMIDLKQDELDMMIEEADEQDAGRVYISEVYKLFMSKK